MSHFGWRRKTVRLTPVIFFAILSAGPAVPQTDVNQQLAEVLKAWEARDFTRVEAAGLTYLAAMGDFASAPAVAALSLVSGAETVAGRLKAAAMHLAQGFESLVQYSCVNQVYPHRLAGVTIGQLLRDLPPRSRPNLEVVMSQVWEGLARKGRESGPRAEMYRGLATMAAAGLASLYLMVGDTATARSFAGEAWISAPPAEIYPAEIYQIATSSTICGCIRMKSRTEFLRPGDFRFEDHFREYVRELTYGCFHLPRAWALTAALAVYIQVNDTDRIRRTAYALEDLRDRSLTTGSLDGDPYIRGQVDATYELVKKRYAHLWPAPETVPPVLLSEAENDPRLGKTGPPYVGKRKGQGSTLTERLILLKATPPAGMDRAAPEQPWWLYRLGKGQLRVVGRAKTWKAAKNSEHQWELRVERLALGDLWSTDGFFADFKTKRTLELLGPVFVSQELLGLDFQGLPPHRLQLFKEGLPWVGMSERLMRVNMSSCTSAMIQRNEMPRDFEVEQTIPCTGWTVSLRDGRVVAVTRNGGAP